MISEVEYIKVSPPRRRFDIYRQLCEGQEGGGRSSAFFQGTGPK